MDKRAEAHPEPNERKRQRPMTILKRPNQDRRSNNSSQPSEAIGPIGAPLRLEDLPPPNTKRWVARRKAEVVAAVRADLLTLKDACRRYSLSEDEYKKLGAPVRQPRLARSSHHPHTSLPRRRCSPGHKGPPHLRLSKRILQNLRTVSKRRSKKRCAPVHRFFLCPPLVLFQKARQKLPSVNGLFTAPTYSGYDGRSRIQ